MKKPSRQPEVLDIIERHGPITTQSIAHQMRMDKGCVSYYIGQLKGSLHIGDWSVSRTKQGKANLSGMWAAGPGIDKPKPKITPARLHVPIELDLSLMPFRSVFAGGVSPWAGMAA